MSPVQWRYSPTGPWPTDVLGDRKLNILEYCPRAADTRSADRGLLNTDLRLYINIYSGGKILPHSVLRGGVFPGEASRRRRRGMKIGTWNVRSFYRAGSFKAAARELGRYKLDVVGVQEVRWDKGGTTSCSQV